MKVVLVGLGKILKRLASEINLVGKLGVVETAALIKEAALFPSPGYRHIGI